MQRAYLRFWYEALMALISSLDLVHMISISVVSSVPAPWQTKQQCLIGFY